MLSFAAAVFDDTGKMLGTFSRNLELLPNASADPDTMEFWRKNQSAYDATRANIVDPREAMQSFVVWVTSFKTGRPNFVAYPAGFDFTWVYWYMINFLGSNTSPFSFSAIDIKTYASAMLKLPYRDSTKKNMPKRWFSSRSHTHIAEDDAIEQGELFMNMFKENKTAQQTTKVEREQTFDVGDVVNKVGGDYSFKGVVRSSFSKASGATRYAVEDDRGVLHIYSAKNLVKA